MSNDITSEAGRRSGRITARHIQLALGAVWLLDGLLQLQPKMFGQAFTNDVLMPASMGQPGPVSGAMTHMAHLISVQPAVVNAVFAAVQILIGVGLLVRDTVKPALLLSFAWGLGVWALGEGFGGLLTGQASPLTGAPGAALLYVAIGLLVWPRRDAADVVSGPAAAESRLGELGGRAIWATLWSGLGILWLLPVNRAPGALSGALSQAGSGEPAWLAHWESSASSLLAGHGTSVAVFAAVLSFAIGLGPLLTRHSAPFLVAGMAVALDFWVFGQAFGAMFTGIGTDPNAGPLIILLALTVFPTRAVIPARDTATMPRYEFRPSLLPQRAGATMAGSDR